MVETALRLDTVLCSFSRILREIPPTQQHLPPSSSSIVARTKQPCTCAVRAGCKHDVITICANSASHPSLHGLDPKKNFETSKDYYYLKVQFQHLKKAPQTLIEVNILKNRMIKINCYSRRLLFEFDCNSTFLLFHPEFPSGS